MGLETGSYISDLVATNPPGTDPKSQGDDHLRLVKDVLKKSFPLVNGVVNIAPGAGGRVDFPHGVTPRSWVSAGLPVIGTTYPNPTKSDLIISYFFTSTDNAAIGIAVDGIENVAYMQIPGTGYGNVSAVIPSGGNWAVRETGGPVTFLTAAQLAGA